MKRILSIMDMADSPDFNPETNRGRGDWSLRDVSAGEVFIDIDHGTPACVLHGAMNSVSPLGTIWRCLTCGRSCYTQRG